MEDLKLSNYDYFLPSELIAQRPTAKRPQSRLLIYNAKSDSILDSYFYKLNEHLPKNSHLVFNNSKVFPCRLFGKKTSGGNVELFVLDLEVKNNLYPCLCKASGKRKIGEVFIISGIEAKIKDLESGKVFVEFLVDDFEKFLYQNGSVPIPPYIRDGKSDEKDRSDYQTVYAKDQGSVAAPTAGLHFDENLLSQLKSCGHKSSELCLHVGLGTFAPVKVDDLSNHQMHSERFSFAPKDLQEIKEHWGGLIAVGTTSLRGLESSCNEKGIINIEDSKFYETDIFLYPGKKIHSVKGLITNFHLPKSTLLMLVSSLIGREKTLEIYDYAIKKKYRFFSYGDAMLILL